MNDSRSYACGHLVPVAAGREPDYGDGVAIYRHTFGTFLIRTHRTVRTSPAGWVYGIYENAPAPDYGDQYTVGYATTQREALCEAAHYIAGVCPIAAAPLSRVSTLAERISAGTLAGVS